VRPGDRLLEERGGSDGGTRAEGNRTRQVEVLMLLKATMRATQEARQLAEMADKWAAPPSRAHQRLAWGRGVAPRWPEGQGPLHAGVMRCWKTKNKRSDPLV
jgi:hypothetical protein